MYQFPERSIEEDGENMYFDDSVMDLISSANDICVVFGMYDYL